MVANRESGMEGRPRKAPRKNDREPGPGKRTERGTSRAPRSREDEASVQDEGLVVVPLQGVAEGGRAAGAVAHLARVRQAARLINR